jgi:hypothetical protein
MIDTFPPIPDAALMNLIAVIILQKCWFVCLCREAIYNLIKKLDEGYGSTSWPG